MITFLIGLAILFVGAVIKRNIFTLATIISITVAAYFIALKTTLKVLQFSGDILLGRTKLLQSLPSL